MSDALTINAVPSPLLIPPVPGVIPPGYMIQYVPVLTPIVMD